MTQDGQAIHGDVRDDGDQVEVTHAGRKHRYTRTNLKSVRMDREIEADYQQYLQRPADPGGLASWLNALSHGLRDEGLLAGVAGSQEYFEQL